MKSTAKKDEMFNIAESAEFLGITQSCVRAWVWKRRIESVRVGRAVRIRRSVLERIVADRTVPADPRRAVA